MRTAVASRAVRLVTAGAAVLVVTVAPAMLTSAQVPPTPAAGSGPTTAPPTTTSTTAPGAPTPPAPDLRALVPDKVAISSTVDRPSVTPGTAVTFSLDVSNGGARPLSAVVVRSPGCSPLAPPAMTGGNQDAVIDPGEHWRYTCRRTVTTEVTQISTVWATTADDHVVMSQASSTVHPTAPGLRVDLSADHLAAVPGTTVTFVADVSTGDQTPLTIGSVVLPGCGPVLGPARLGGDDDDLVEPGETWRYLCTRTLSDTATTTVVAGGNDGTGAAVTGTDQLQVVAIHPAVALAEAVPAPVAAGARSTFDYVVTNPGDVPVSGVRIASSACAPVGRVGADPNANRLLDPGEAWGFRCRTLLASTTADVAVVSAQDVLLATSVTATSSAPAVVTGRHTIDSPSTTAPAPGSPTPTDQGGGVEAPTPSYDPGSGYDPYADGSYDPYSSDSSDPYAYDSYDPYAYDPYSSDSYDPYAYDSYSSDCSAYDSTDYGSTDYGSTDNGSTDYSSTDDGSTDPFGSDSGSPPLTAAGQEADGGVSGGVLAPLGQDVGGSSSDSSGYDPSGSSSTDYSSDYSSSDYSSDYSS